MTDKAKTAIADLNRLLDETKQMAVAEEGAKRENRPPADNETEWLAASLSMRFGLSHDQTRKLLTEDVVFVRRVVELVERSLPWTITVWVAKLERALSKPSSNRFYEHFNKRSDKGSQSFLQLRGKGVKKGLMS